MLGMTEAFVGGGALEDGEPSSRLVEGTRTESRKRMVIWKQFPIRGCLLYVALDRVSNLSGFHQGAH